MSAIRAFALRFRPEPAAAPAASPAEDGAAIAAALPALALRPFAPAADPEMAGTAPSVAGAGATVGLSGAAIREGSPLASSIRMALADGAEREADLEGWLVLVRPDGRRLVLAPHAMVELEKSGRLPPLPEPVDRAAGSACARPPSWSEVEDAPEPGDRCVCGGRRWWRHAHSPQGWWCAACRPAAPQGRHGGGGNVNRNRVERITGDAGEPSACCARAGGDPGARHGAPARRPSGGRPRRTWPAPAGAKPSGTGNPGANPRERSQAWTS